MKFLVFSVVIFLCVNTMAGPIKKASNCTDYTQYTDIEYDELKKFVKGSKATIIDVNSGETYTSSHIPGAIHFGTNKKNLAKVLPKNKKTPIITYCGGKMCTAWRKAAKAACEMGYKKVLHYSEGIKGWKEHQKRG